MRFCVERQSRVGVGQWCVCTSLQDAPSSSGFLYHGFRYPGFPKIDFQCFYNVRNDSGQGTGGGTKNRAAAPRDEINQNENS